MVCIGELAALVKLGSDRGDLLLGEVARRLADHLVLVGQV
jgi:hypothetical protein